MAELTTSKTIVCIVLLSVAVDLAVSTILFGHVTQFREQLAAEARFYEFASSLFEFWVISLLRSSLVLGFLFGVYRNGTMEGVMRLRAIHIPVLTLVIVICVFGIVKMLVYTEKSSDIIIARSGFWFWIQFAWVEFASLWFYVIYILLKNLSIREEVVSAEVKSENSVNATEEERRQLIDSMDSDIGDKSEEQKRTASENVSSIMRLMFYSKPDLPYLIVAFIFMVLSSLAEIFTPWYTGQVIQGIAIDKSKANFTRAIIFMGLFSAASAFFAGIRGGLFKVAMARLNIRIRNLLFSSIVKQEVGFFDTTKTGDVTSRLTSDTTTMSDALSLNFNVFVRSIIKAIGVCVFMFRLSWRLSMVTVVGLPIIMSISKLYGDYYEALSKKVQDSLARANEVAEEVCSSMRTVHSFANEEEESLRYSQRLDVTYKLNIKEAFAYAGYVWSNQLFSLSLVVSTLYYGGHLVVDQMMTGGDLVSFILYQMELGYALESISSVYTGLMQAVGASQKVFDYIDRKPQIPTCGQLAPDKLEGRLEFRNVTFSYPAQPNRNVLENVSFKVDPGEVVALVGPSGSGKSSCVNLLEHFYETRQGDVLLDGVPISQYDHKYLHQKISLVGQEPVLYGRSIKDNIAYGMDVWTMDEVVRAAIQANAHSFITDMKDQYETDAGEKGTRLSGGQKQRIAIARAIIRNPTVLLLDEATSALDSESEHVVQQAIYSNLKGRTVIVIAHRLSTVERADRIIVINKGKIVEEGTHAQLLQKTSGLYHKLVQRQMFGFEIGTVDHNTPRKVKSVASKHRTPSCSNLDDDVNFYRSSSEDLHAPKYGSPKYGSMA